MLLSNSYPPVLGGLQTITHLLARQLVQRGHAVQVVTQRYPRTLPARSRLDGVGVQRWLFLTPEWRAVRQGRPDLLAAALVVFPLTLLRLIALTRRFRPEVINVHFPEAQVPYVLWLRRLFRFRLVVSLHGHEVQRWTGAPHEAAALAAWCALLRSANAVTACSHALLDAATAWEPALLQTGQVIYNGIDLRRFAGATAYRYPRPYCLAYGRLTPKKGFDLLLDALARLGSAGALPLDLIVAGTGEARPALEAQAQHLGLTERVRFIGRASEADIATLLQGCRFAVVPSREEPFGCAALEAMVAGAPLVATNVGGLPEVVAALSSPCLLPAYTVHGEGTNEAPDLPVQLVAPTVEALTGAMAIWLREAPNTQRDGRPAPEQLEQFSMTHMVAAYEQVLQGA